MVSDVWVLRSILRYLRMSGIDVGALLDSSIPQDEREEV
jgi:hypothetical protein